VQGGELGAARPVAEALGEDVGAVVGVGRAAPVVADGGFRAGVPGEALCATHVAAGGVQVEGDGGGPQSVWGELRGGSDAGGLRQALDESVDVQGLGDYRSGKSR
jgi:hypothetical protein